MAAGRHSIKRIPMHSLAATAMRSMEALIRVHGNCMLSDCMHRTYRCIQNWNSRAVTHLPIVDATLGQQIRVVAAAPTKSFISAPSHYSELIGSKPMVIYHVSSIGVFCWSISLTHLNCKITFRLKLSYGTCPNRRNSINENRVGRLLRIVVPPLAKECRMSRVWSASFVKSRVKKKGPKKQSKFLTST